MRVRERVLELEDVSDVRAPEPVDRIVGDDSVGDEVVGVLDVEVVDRPVEFDPRHRLDHVVAAALVEHHHARADERRRRERQRATVGAQASQPDVGQRRQRLAGAVPRARGRRRGAKRDTAAICLALCTHKHLRGAYVHTEAAVAPPSHVLHAPSRRIPAPTQIPREVRVLGRAHEPAPRPKRDRDPVHTRGAVHPDDRRRPERAATVARPHEIPHGHVLDRAPRPVGHRDRRPRHQALRVIPDHHQVATLLGQQLEPAVLGVVGVLVLVDEHVTKAGGVLVAHLLEQLEHVDCAHQQIVEVHRVHAVHLALVHPVHVRHRLLEERADHVPVGVGVAQLVLGVGDLAVDRVRREALGIDPKLVQAALDQPPRVGLIVDREPARVPELVGVGTEHPGAGGVEGHHPHRADPPAHQQLSAIAHLPRRLVGERDRQDLVRLGRVGGDQIGDPVREDPRLPRPRAGQDQQRAFAVGDRLALGVVEAGEERLELGGGVCHGGIQR
jgi:hypothetical protein